MKQKFLFLLLLMTIIAPLYAKTILIVGDSLSAGYGLAYGQGWVNLLGEKLKQARFDYRIINVSTSGDTTSNGLLKLTRALKKSDKPEIVIIELGANDGLRGLTIKEMQTNLEKMIQQSQKVKAKVLLLATLLPPNYGPVYLTRFAQVYKDLATKYQVALVPMFLQGIAGDSALMQKDGLHPNANAQAKIVDNVWAALQPLLDK